MQHGGINNLFRGSYPKIKIAKETPLSLANKLSSWIAGSLMADKMDFMSRDDKFIIPSIVLIMRVTLAGNYTFACKLINMMIWSVQ